ncbi:cullin-4A-like [Tribolium castaneum]|uniref:Cullin homolog 1-like Protein n=1 Tax=Tribolium castaneum TaxID=7070 RepID=D6X1T0_TRICA|nr:Cullin homolog 1-like Protein [Tribolium castaneum]
MSTKKNVITIRNFRGLTPTPPETIEKKWQHLEAEIVTIFNTSNYTNLEELYRIAEELYTAKYAPLLYNLQVLIESYLTQKLESIVANVSNVLFVVDQFWKEFCQHVKTIKNIFLYYDRSPKFFKYNTVQSISLGLFTSVVILNPVVRKNLVEEILRKVEDERRTLTTDHVTVLKSTINMLNVLQVYEDIFTSDFLKSTHDFYEDEASRNINTMEVPQYLSLVNKRITQEQERVTNYLNKNTEAQLLDIVYTQLIEKQITEILNKGFDQLIDKNMHSELVLIYKLFQKISNGTKHLISYFKDYIVKKGTTITDAKNEKNMIQDLLDFKDDLDKIIELSFENRKEFHECVRLAFKNFINSFHAKSAQLLAKYLDVKLRSKDITDEELEVVLTKVIKLFKHVQGKDIFEAFYKKLLAKRLLLGKSANQDAENSMISKLRDECGSAFTSNIEGMFQDINLSKSINNSFKQKVRNQENGFTSEFSVNVLTSSYWPNYPNYAVNLPCELVTYQQSFQKFYLSNHSGRKLLWQPSLTHCLLKASFECGVKELQVSLFQTVVLLLFNASPEIAFKEIQEATSLDGGELKRTLLSLVYGKARILLKTPKTKEIEDDDVFVFNNKFTDKLFRVKINQIQLQDSPEDEKETEKNVLVDRQFQIDAAIVRIMKSKKTIKHYMLVRELYKVLDIPVNQTDLKKRIELLIEREYMERDKDNKSTYIYIA